MSSRSSQCGGEKNKQVDNHHQYGLCSGLTKGSKRRVGTRLHLEGMVVRVDFLVEVMRKLL